MGYMSDLDIKRHEAGIGPILSRWDEMTDTERAIGALIGPGFWQCGNMIGLDDYRDTRTVGRRLRVAMETLKANGYHATMGFTKDRRYVLLVNPLVTEGAR